VRDRVVTDVNDHLCAMLGYPAEEMLGRSATLIYPSEDESERVGTELYGRIAEAGMTTVETRWVRKDGRLIDVILTCTPVEPDDLAAGFAFTALDVTDRKLAAEEARHSGELYRTLVETMDEGVGVNDENHCFTYANPRLLEIIGYEMEEILGRPMMAFVAEDHRKLLEDEISRRIKGEVSLYDLDWVRKDGTRVPTLISATAIRDQDGRFRGSLGVVTDVTERRSLEAQLLQAQKMEGIGRLAGGVAHDFNNQLTVIHGYCDFLLRRLPDGDEALGPLREIRRAGARAQKLTSQLLAFSRRQVLQPEIIRLQGVLAELENPLARMLGEDVHLSLHSDPDTGAVRLDRTQLEQAIMNLAVNARDAMPRGGRLKIRTRRADVDETLARGRPGLATGSYVVLAVEDDGVGMDPATRERVFEPFFTTKDVGKGTGLGLSMVYGFVKQSAGFVEVDSAPGRGTTVNLYLPAASAEPPAPAASALGEIPGGTETILVTEDEPAVRSFLVRLLTELGYTVLEAASAADALETARTHPHGIDLLVTDIVMPVSSGPQLVETLRAEGRNFPVLFISGYSEHAIMRDNVIKENARFVAKPFRVGELGRIIREILEGVAP
jgi:PAS domain S-box-containing protein